MQTVIKTFRVASWIFGSLNLWLIIVFIILNLKIPKTIQDVYLARDSNLEHLHVEQENSRIVHDCSFHCLQRQGNTFLVKASVWFYHILAGKIAALHILHMISSHHWVGISRVQIHALDVRFYELSPCEQLFKPSRPRHGFPYQPMTASFPCLQRQGNTFLVKAYVWFYHILAGKIAALHILHMISSHHWVGMSRVQIHALDVRFYELSPCEQLFKPSRPCHGFPDHWTLTYYSVYNSELEDTLKNTRCLPCQGFEPGTSSCGTIK